LRATGFAVLILLLPALTSSPVPSGHFQLPVPSILFGNPYSSTQNTPPYAFNGAFANYTLTYFTEQGEYDYKSEFIVSNVDQMAQTFSVRSVYNSYLEAFGSVDNATFEQPIPFPAVSPSQLQLFKEGKAPVGYYNDNVSSNVVVKVPAGTFVTYKVQAPVSTVWFDSKTGLLVQENGLMLGQGSGFVGLVLATTNIKSSPSSEGLDAAVVLLVSVSAATACVVALAASSRRSEKDGPPGQVKSEQGPGEKAN